MSSFLEWKEEKYKIIHVGRTQTLQIEGVSDDRQSILYDKTLIYVITVLSIFFNYYRYLRVSVVSGITIRA